MVQLSECFLKRDLIKADHQNDNGDPQEKITHYNHDPSWEEELNMFAKYIIDDVEVSSGSSLDALNTMKLVYRIYYADPDWRKSYNIQNPDK